jgi:hypothetical protein
MRRLLFLIAPLLALAAARPAFAQMSNVVDVGVLTNCSAAALSSPIASCEVRSATVTGVKGFNLLTLEILYTDGGAGAGLGFSFVLQSCREGMGALDCTDAADWYTVQTEKVVDGAITIINGTVTHDATATERLVWSVGINYQRLRLASVTGLGSPGATDKITVYARLAGAAAY